MKAGFKTWFASLEGRLPLPARRSGRRLRTARSGYALIEVLIALFVLVIVSEAFLVATSNFATQTNIMKERIIATSKAVQMLQELRSVAATSLNIGALDAYDDQNHYRYILTTDSTLTNVTQMVNGVETSVFRPDQYSVAGSFESGNPIVNGGYLFVRQITVKPQTNDESVRQIWVRVYLAAKNDGDNPDNISPTAASPGSPALAEVYGLVRASSSPTPPSQVIDLYLIALENVPGWWVRTASLHSLMQTVVNEIQASNPGLILNQHIISRMSFGRDLEYTPEINDGIDATQYSWQKTYVYPGQISYDSGHTDPPYYYQPSYFNARMNDTGTIINGGVTETAYALADQFNYAMRFRDENDLYTYFNQAANSNNPSLSQGNLVSQISLRQLLDALNDTTCALFQQLQNSIIINEHGEMVPVPPLDNVSFPAKDPYDFGPGTSYNRSFRAVTHPEQLHYNTSTDTVALRVYAYDGSGNTSETGNMIPEVTLFIPGASLNNLATVSKMIGDSNNLYGWNNYTNTNNSTAQGVSWTADGGYLADNYVDAWGRSGLRIQLFGVTATANEYDP